MWKCIIIQLLIVKNKKKWYMTTLLTMKVSLNDAKIWATPKTCSPGWTAGPRVIFSSLGSLVFFLDYKTIHENYAISNYMCNAVNRKNIKLLDKSTTDIPEKSTNHTWSTKVNKFETKNWNFVLQEIQYFHLKTEKNISQL